MPHAYASKTKNRPAYFKTTLQAQKKVVIVLIAAIVAQLALVTCFVGAMNSPRLHHAAVAYVRQPGAPAIENVHFHPVDAIQLRSYSSERAATTAVEHGDIAAAIVRDTQSEKVIVAGAAGPVLTASIEQTVQAQAKAAGIPVSLRDVNALPTHDSRALSTFLLTIGWVIGGYLGIMLLTRALGAAGRTPTGAAMLVGWTAVYAFTSAALGVFLVDCGLHVVTGNAWPIIAAGSLIVFTVGIFTASLLSLLGMSGLVVAIASLVILGNPTSGGSVPTEMLSGGWRVLADILPTNAGVRLVRSIQYFHGHNISGPLAILGAYAIAALALITFVTIQRHRSKLLQTIRTDLEDV